MGAIVPQWAALAPGASGLIWYFGAETDLLILHCECGHLWNYIEVSVSNGCSFMGSENMKKKKVLQRCNAGAGVGGRVAKEGDK